jgi:dihydroorotase
MLDLDLSRCWLVDPWRRREGPAELVVRGGTIRSIRWLRDPDRAGIDDHGVVVAPAFVDLHAHLREPGNDAAETVATGMAAAAHGGFGTVCVMPNTEPPIDTAAGVALLRDAVSRATDQLPSDLGPVTVRAWGAATAARAGEHLAALGELADAGVVGFSDDGAPIGSAVLLRSALAYAGMLGLTIVDHAEDATLTAAAEAGEGLIATVLGLKGWPVAAEVTAVARDIALLEDVARDVPAARLHLTHLSTAAALDVVRAAKARGARVSCDVTPHHVALTDEWLAGSRRWSWEAVDDDGRRRDPWIDGALVAGPFDTSLRVNPPLRSPEDAVACLAALADGTADAIATDHAPHAEVDKAVEFGLAANGISGIETALGVGLAAVDAGRISLSRLVEALTAGPMRIIDPTGAPGLVEGALASLVVFDRSETWRVGEETLRSRGRNSPLLGRSLPGRVLLTVQAGKLVYRAD